MARAVVSLPRLLEPAVGAVRKVEVEGDTWGEAIAALLDRHPTLRVHLFDEESRLRPHVMCFVNGQQTRLEDRAVALDEGAEITFLQAVSGG
jgi:molybdopterin converting factor small subunit